MTEGFKNLPKTDTIWVAAQAILKKLLRNMDALVHNIRHLSDGYAPELSQIFRCSVRIARSGLDYFGCQVAQCGINSEKHMEHVS